MESIVLSILDVECGVNFRWHVLVHTPVTSHLNCLPEKYFGVQNCSRSPGVPEVYQKGQWLQLMFCTAPLSCVLLFVEEYQRQNS